MDPQPESIIKGGSPLKPLDKLGKIGDITKDLTGVAEKALSTNKGLLLLEAHKLDMSSKYMLPQIIRPLMALMFLIASMTILVYEMITQHELPLDTKAFIFGNTGIMITMYVNSRRQEKLRLNENKAKIHAQESEQEHNQRMEERRQKHELKMATKRERREARRHGWIHKSRGKKSENK